MYRIALIGYGRWGKVLVPYLQDRFDVAWIFGRSLKKVGIFTNSLDDVFDKSVDAVFVATPVGTHSYIVTQALENKKHVFCEKPLATNPDVAARMIKLAGKNNVHLVTDYTYTFCHRLTELRDYIEQTKQPVKQIEFILTRTEDLRDRDIRWTLACHALSVVGLFVDLEKLQFYTKKSTERHSLHFLPFYLNDTCGISTVAMGEKTKETSLHIKTDKTSIRMEGLHEDDNIGPALDYFVAVIDGKQNNAQNISQSCQITKILSSL